MLNLWRLQLLRLPFPFSRFSLKHRTHGKRSDNPIKEKQIKIAMQPDLLPHKVSPQVKREMRQRTDEIFALAEESENAAPLTPQELTPGEFMKHMNTSLEYFFSKYLFLYFAHFSLIVWLRAFFSDFFFGLLSEKAYFAEKFLPNSIFLIVLFELSSIILSYFYIYVPLFSNLRI